MTILLNEVMSYPTTACGDACECGTGGGMRGTGCSSQGRGQVHGPVRRGC